MPQRKPRAPARRKGAIESATYRELQAAGRHRGAVGQWALAQARAIDGPPAPELVDHPATCSKCEHAFTVHVPVPTADHKERAVMGRELRMAMKQALTAETGGGDEPDVSRYGTPG